MADQVIKVDGVPLGCREMLAQMIANKSVSYEISFTAGGKRNQSVRGRYVRHSSESLTIEKHDKSRTMTFDWSNIDGLYR